MCSPGMLVAVAVLSGACGGSPSAPSPAATALALSSGTYRLIMQLGMGLPSCDGPFCAAVVICGGPARPGSVVSVLVSLDRNGDEATVRQNESRSTLVMTMRIGGNAVTGTMSGRAFDAAGTPIEVKGVSDGPASLSGGPTDRGTVMGMLNGHVTIGGASCSGDQSTWRLERA